MNRRLTVSLVLASLACTPTPSAPTEPPADNPVVVERDTAHPPVEVTFGFATLGSTGEFEFWERIEKPEPALLTELWREEELPPAIAGTVDRAFGTAEQRQTRADESGVDSGQVTLDNATVRELGLAPPVSPIWLISPCGPVRAEPTVPILGWYTWGLEAVELSWSLALGESEPSCAQPGAWSQIAVIAESLPAELRYVRATERRADRVDPTAGPDREPWSTHVRAAVTKTSEANQLRADEVWLRERVVPGTDLVELTIAVVERDRAVMSKPAEPCMDRQVNVIVVGLVEDGVLTPYTLANADGPVEDAALRGAFVRDGEVVWTVHEHWGQALVHAPERSPSVVELEVASYHPEDLGMTDFAQIQYCGP